MANSLAARTRDFTLTYAVEPVFNNLKIFWKLPLCQEPSHGMKVPFCICKSPGFYLYGICAWILMLFEPCDVCTSVSHVFFHPPWKPHSSSSAAMKTPARIPLLSSHPPQHSFASCHHAFLCGNSARAKTLGLLSSSASSSNLQTVQIFQTSKHQHESNFQLQQSAWRYFCWQDLPVTSNTKMTAREGLRHLKARRGYRKTVEKWGKENPAIARCTQNRMRLQYLLPALASVLMLAVQRWWLQSPLS